MMRGDGVYRKERAGCLKSSLKAPDLHCQEDPVLAAYLSKGKRLVQPKSCRYGKSWHTFVTAVYPIGGGFISKDLDVYKACIWQWLTSLLQTPQQTVRHDLEWN